MSRTATKAPTAMTCPRAKGATAALPRAGAEGEAATRDMALSTPRHEAGSGAVTGALSGRHACERHDDLLLTGGGWIATGPRDRSRKDCSQGVSAGSARRDTRSGDAVTS